MISHRTHLVALVALTLAAAAAAAGCGKDKEAGADKGASGAKATDPGAEAPGPRTQERIKAAAEVLASDANCKALAACCVAIADTSNDPAKTVCGQFHRTDDLAQAVQDGFDATMLPSTCENWLGGVRGTGNDANPLPAACN